MASAVTGNTMRNRNGTLVKYGCIGLLLAATSSGCLSRQVKFLLEDLEDSRSSDARVGVLTNELDAASAARLELIGRTSAPTRYGERTDANRIRIVAFDFGGTKLGQLADFAGNQLQGSCLSNDLNDNLIQVGPWLGDAVPPKNGEAFYKGMFRQYEKRVGTTIEFDAAIGPVGTEVTSYFSNNLLVLEWRRYQLRSLKHQCIETHVSAVEHGVAVRIVFDVRLSSTNASINATFGIAELAAALARNEARVDVSYEVVGTVLDLLPRETIVISSLSEYLDALDRFHSAVVSIGDAWAAYSQADSDKATITVKINDSDHTYTREELFVPDELAYYVSGRSVGDAFLHMNNVETCQDLNTLVEYYDGLIAKYDGPNGSIAGENNAIKQAEEERKKVQTRVEANETRRKLREHREKLRQLESQRDKAKYRKETVDFSFVQNNCKVSLELEDLRIAHGCAVQQLEEKDRSTGDKGMDRSTLELAQCSRVKRFIKQEVEYLQSVRETQDAQQQVQQEQQQQQQQQQQPKPK